ncbi:hypothetical protein BC826DRAFT_1019077 [Russula brevipes]|nr:hypothetical protein BC826DRAFT_1019077 [Russula brevipes]
MQSSHSHRARSQHAPEMLRESRRGGVSEGALRPAKPTACATLPPTTKRTCQVQSERGRRP